MSKTKTPILSLGAHGTIGDALTYQKRGRQTIVRNKPFPVQPNTLAQQYQRWLYEDYCYLWRQQSIVIRQQYSSAGSRFYLTGFQYWMKYHLANLPDIAAMYHLDTGETVTAIDFSRNANHGTIIGASPTDGLINGALYCDGLNDYIDCGAGISLKTASVTAEAWVKLQTGGVGNDYILQKGDWAIDGWLLFYNFNTDEVICAVCWGGGGQLLKYSYAVDGDWHHFVFTYDETTRLLALYIDGAQVNSVISGTAMIPSDLPLYIGAHAAPGNYLYGSADAVCIYNRALDVAEILRHSLRRWPL